MMEAVTLPQDIVERFEGKVCKCEKEHIHGLFYIFFVVFLYLKAVKQQFNA